MQAPMGNKPGTLKILNIWVWIIFWRWNLVDIPNFTWEFHATVKIYDYLSIYKNCQHSASVLKS